MKKNNFENRKLAISELADAAGVTIRTIRYYIKEGLLPPPQTQGRYALYDRTYLNRLELIRRWKDSYLPLKEIRVRIQPLSDREVETLLANTEARQDDPQRAQPVMNAGSEGRNNKKGANKSKREGVGKNAATYARQVREGKQEEDSSAAEYAHSARRQHALPGTSKPHVYPSHLKQQGEEWRHIRVMPGFELHLSEGMYRQYHRELQELLAWINQKFGNLRNRA